MRVYSKAVCQWQPDGSLKFLPDESDSFEYSGPVLECKGGSSPPPAPDYAGAARETQRSQMSSQYTPYGSSVYSADPSSPSGYRSDITLNPQAQQTLDQLLQNWNTMGGLSGEQLNRVGSQLTQPMDLSSVQDVSDRAYGAMTSRLDPQWQARDAAFETQMRNQGLVPGGEAYNEAKRLEDAARNDAYQQANLGAISTMPQTYQLAESAYNAPLNRYNALATGAQIQNPQFTSQPGANYLGAALGQNQYNMGLYNAGVAEQNSFQSGLFGLGSAGLGAYGTYAGMAAL